MFSIYSMRALGRLRSCSLHHDVGTSASNTVAVTKSVAISALRHAHATRRLCSESKVHSSQSAVTPAKPSAFSKFGKLGLHKGVVDGLAAQGIVQPTPIQELAIPAALKRRNVVIAAETGSGKTFAYLAPLISLMKNTESPLRRRPSRPRGIILVPTRELVMQILGVAKSLAHTAKFSSRPAVGGPHKRTQRKALLEEPTDLLVATPGMLAHMREEKLVMLSDLEFVVVDEADVTLAAQGFHEQTDPFLKAVDAKPRLDPPQKAAQFIYAAATLPASVRRLLNMRHPSEQGLFYAESNDLHRATSHERVRVKFLRVAGGEEVKLMRAVELVMDAIRSSTSGKVMLFCDRDNRRTQIVEKLRDSHRMAVVHMSREVDRLDRWSDWKRFRDDPDVRVAVCAQSLSRGIDHTGVENVIMTDVPMTGNEYLHRVGRIRNHGAVTVLVSNRDRAVAEALFLAHVNDEDLSKLNAPAAWRSYIDSGRDRIASDLAVARARRSGRAVWADERSSAVGTARGLPEAGQSRKKTGSRMSSTHSRYPGRQMTQYTYRKAPNSGREYMRRDGTRMNRGRNGMTQRENSRMRTSRESQTRRGTTSSREWRDVPRALRYEKRRYADAGPYSGGKWGNVESDRHVL